METDQTRPETEKTKKKCHGNRKLYHFKRKCRSRGMTEEQITVLINTRNNGQQHVNNAGSTVVLPSRHQLEQKKQKLKKRPNKRKQAERKDEEQNQMNKSMSQISISQQSRPKKLKTKEDEGTMQSTIHSNLM